MRFTKRKKDKDSFEPILSPSQWPVVQLSKNRKEFIDSVTEEGVSRLKSIKTNKFKLIEELETTLFREKARIKKNPWKVDPEDEGSFWSGIKVRLINITTNTNSEEDSEDKILADIVRRYAEEIAGNFKQNHYRMAREIVKFGFARLLNAARIKRFGDFFRNKYTLKDKIVIKGYTEEVRELATKGTVVLVPTHFSNLDSILIGWIIHILGLPPVIYGAGLNLFNTKILAYFMNSLGAYKVDRRKKNLIYIETLKAYSSMALQKGAHSLFFPGGTRSRSGKIEKELKLGLLNSTIDAQRIIYSKNIDNKIFIVPVVINYHFVLEAPLLINQYLKRKGQERFYEETDEYSSSYKMIMFLMKFFTKGSDISVSIGKPMDVLGNSVNENGESLDNQNRVIDTRDYFLSANHVSANKQREEVYTRMLSKAIVEEFHRSNQVFASHMVAYVAFRIWRKKFNNLDLYSFLRLNEEDLLIPQKKFKKGMKKLRKVLFALETEQKLSIAPHVKQKMNDVIKHGIDNVGMYHAKRPLLMTKEGDIITKDLNTLYFYHNRLEGYELEKYI